MKVAYQSISLKNTVVEIVKTPRILFTLLILFGLEFVLWIRVFLPQAAILLIPISFCVMLYQNGYSISYAHNIYSCNPEGLPLLSDWLRHIRRGIGKMIIFFAILIAFMFPLLLVFEMISAISSFDIGSTLPQVISFAAVIPSVLLWIRYVRFDKLFVTHTDIRPADFFCDKKILFIIIAIEISVLLIILLANQLLHACISSDIFQSRLMYSGVIAVVAAAQSLIRTGGLLLSGNLLGQYARMVYRPENFDGLTTETTSDEGGSRNVS
ncbi:MAG: hypothetical protein FWG78_01970 [Coriobacteriia bacterium]|nr:hypothetical protein [Coriobacteriia bacterium]